MIHSVFSVQFFGLQKSFLVYVYVFYCMYMIIASVRFENICSSLVFKIHTASKKKKIQKKCFICLLLRAAMPTINLNILIRLFFCFVLFQLNKCVWHISNIQNRKHFVFVAVVLQSADIFQLDSNDLA